MVRAMLCWRFDLSVPVCVCLCVCALVAIGVRRGEAMVPCGHCGVDMRATARFCKSCGKGK